MCRSGAKYPGIRPPHSSRVYFLSIILHCPLCIHILNAVSSLSLLCTHVILWSLLCQICLLIGQHRRIKEFRKLFSLITLWLSRSWKKGLIKKNPKLPFWISKAKIPFSTFYCACSVARPCLTVLQPNGLLCPWDFSGKNTGVGCHFLVQRIFPKWKWKWSPSVVSDSLWPRELAGSSIHPWDFPGKSTEVGCHFLLQGIFPAQELNLGLLNCRQTLLPSEPPGIKPASPALAGRFFTAESPRKPLPIVMILLIPKHWLFSIPHPRKNRWLLLIKEKAMFLEIDNSMIYFPHCLKCSRILFLCYQAQLHGFVTCTVTWDPTLWRTSCFA